MWSASEVSQAQKQGAFWYFGNRAGVNFSSGSPVADGNGQMNNLEGVASISDKDGNLLFYTDGQTVYNSTHNVMQDGTGLQGHNSSTQSAVIVPIPSNPNRYYIFTVYENAGALRYSVVDMRGGGGLGRVITKNQLLLSSAPEKITAVLASNETDVWVISHGYGNNTFYVWKITGAGLNTTATTQNIGSTHGNAASAGNVKGESRGYMKASPDGRKIAVAVAGEAFGFGQGQVRNGFVEVLDFDPSTGVLSNPIRFDDGNKPSAVTTYSDVYGVEFSPNSRYLYTTGWGFRGGSRQCLQIDLKAGNNAAVQASAFLVASYNNDNQRRGHFGGIQLAMDGKIYISRNERGWLSCIERPNCPKAACNYVDNAVTLTTGRNGRLGLPTFIQSYFRQADFEFGDPSAPGTSKGLCFSDTMYFWLPDSSGIDSVVWNMGDTAFGAINHRTGFRTSHIYKYPGEYNVQMIVYRGNSNSCFATIDTIVREVSVFEYPQLNIGNDTFFCAGGSVELYVPAVPEAAMIWKSGNQSEYENVNTEGWQWMDIVVNGCKTRDSIYVSQIAYPVIDMPRDTFTCNGNAITLRLSGMDSVRWSNNDTSRDFTTAIGGTYIVKAYNRTCMSEDTVTIANNGVPAFNLGADRTFCAGETLNLSLFFPKDTFTYRWQNNSSDSFFIISSAGTYHVTVSGYYCQRSDTIVVNYQTPTPFSLGADRVMCLGDSVYLNAGIPGATSYRWNNNRTDSAIWAKDYGFYSVEVSDGICNYKDTVLVETRNLVPVTLPNDTTLCIGDSLPILFQVISSTEYRWNNIVYSDPRITIKNSGKYVLRFTDLPDRVCVESDSITVTFQTPVAFSAGRDTMLCNGDRINLNVNYPGTFVSAIWHDAVTGLSRQNNMGTAFHWIEIFDGICRSRDTVNISYFPQVVVDLGMDRILCDNETLNLDATTAGMNQYQWTVDGTPSGNQSNFTVNNPGGRVAVRVGNGLCFGSDSIQVTYFSTPVINLGKDTILCTGDVLPLSIAPGTADNWQWWNGSNTPSATVTQEGNWWLRASNGPNGECASGDTIEVLYTYPPVINFGFLDSNLCDAITFSYNFTVPHTTYRWMDGFNGPTREFSAAGTYWVAAENVCGYDSAGITISIDEFGCRVDMPNAFSPNNDGINDIFRPLGNVYKYETLEIFNRWGETLHVGPGEKGWDGSYKGEVCPGGIYFFRLQYRKLVNGYPRLMVINGIVTLVP